MLTGGQTPCEQDYESRYTCIGDYLFYNQYNLALALSYGKHRGTDPL